ARRIGSRFFGMAQGYYRAAGARESRKLGGFRTSRGPRSSIVRGPSLNFRGLRDCRKALWVKGANSPLTFLRANGPFLFSLFASRRGKSLRRAAGRELARQRECRPFPVAELFRDCSKASESGWHPVASGFSR